MKILRSSRSLRISQSSGGSALLITLAMVTIVTVLLVAFLLLMQTDLVSTNNYSKSIRAQEIAYDALEEVVNDLHSEIDAGSIAGANYTQNNVRIYLPSTNLTATPARIGYPTSAFGTDVDSSGVNLPPTLIRVSRASDPFFTSPPGYYDSTKLPPDRASPVSSTVSSLNNRTLSAARWNKPLLMGTTTPTTFSATPPDWVYVTRSGSMPLTTADVPNLIADAAGANTKAVLGRYAYVMYDEGALLDVNSGGYPSTALTATDGIQIGEKSFLAYADLTQIPGLSQAEVDSLVNWRNAHSISQASSYVSFATNSATNGFLTFTAGENPLLGRQDLINYFNNVGASTQSLAYLGTFSRALSAPSWCPTTPAKSTINYTAISETSSSANRNTSNVRTEGTVTHYNDDGTTQSYILAPGASLIQRRFSLAKLAWLTYAGPAAGASTSAIQACFGLMWDSGNFCWSYVGPSGNTTLSSIETLAQVAAENPPREPNFFETLKAAILSGSLGQDPGPNAVGPIGGQFDFYEANADGHVIQIGVNIIDQASSVNSQSSNYPTAIYFLNPKATDPYLTAAYSRLYSTYFGEKNLPYLTRLYQLMYEYTTAPGTLGGWLQPEIWNPNQTPATAALNGPTQFRLRPHGTVRVAWSQVDPAFTLFGSTTMNFDIGTPQCVYFSSGIDFSTSPTLLTTTNVSAATPTMNLWQSTYTDTSNKFAGIFGGSVAYAPFTGTGAGTINARLIPQLEYAFALEYQAPDGNWHPYGLWSRVQTMDSNNANPFTLPAFSISPVGSIVYVGKSDPRTDRFSSSSGATNLFPPNTTMWPSAGIEYFLLKYRAASVSTLFTYLYPATPPTQLKMDEWAVNMTSSNAYYADVDGVVRPGDGFRGDAAGNGCLTYTGGSNSDGRRPVILNRPFRSVGELGYAFRDLPFKSLDFWSGQSADGGLLDFFSVVDEPPIVAGEIDINAAPVPVLQAVLSGANKENINSTYNISTEAQSLAQNIATSVSLSGVGPLAYRSDLVTKLYDPSNTHNVIAGFSANADKADKAFAEAPLRALAPVANTRTWNLLIDVIAQSGSIPKSAKTLADFLVDGERRYWLHVAIDRYTGKVIDEQLEPVWE